MTQAPAPLAVVNGVDLDAVVAAVRACPGVDDLDGGPPNARLATYLPGRAIDGLKVTEQLVTVQIRSLWDVPVTTVADQIRIAIAHLVVARPVDIIVADLTPAPGYEPEPEPAAAQSEVIETRAPAAASVPEGVPPQDVSAAPAPATAEPVVVERTIMVTEKVLHGDSAAEPAAPAPNPSSTPAPIPETASEPVQVAEPASEQAERRVPQPEGDPLVWVSETPTDDAMLSDGGSDGTTSAPTIPTPAAIPPRS